MPRIVRIVFGVVVLAALLAFALGPRLIERSLNRVTQYPPYRVSTVAQQVHRTLFVADLHADPLLWNRDLLHETSRGHVDIPRLVKGGVALQVFGVVTQVPGGLNYDRNELRCDLITPLATLQRWPLAAWRSAKERARYQARKLHDVAARSAGDFSVIKTVGDLERFDGQRQAKSGRTAGLLAIEGLQAIEGDLANLDILRVAGFRMMGLTHFFDNEVGGSAHGATKRGLTEFGRHAVRRMEELQILIDLAHASPQMVDDVLGMTARPVVVSHTGVKGTCDHIRNLSDNHVRRIAATGGVIGIGYWDAAVCESGVAGIVRAIQYAVRIAGMDHVALGSDFDGATTEPFDTTGLPLITEGLLAAGFSVEDIGRVMGGNVRRLLRETLPEE